MDIINNVINSFKVNDVNTGGGNSYLDVDGKRYSTASHKKIEGERGERGTHKVNEHSQAVFKIIENVWVRKGLPMQEGVAPNFTVTVDLSPEFFVNIIRVIEKCEELLNENTALKLENDRLRSKNESLHDDSRYDIAMKNVLKEELEEKNKKIAELEQQIREKSKPDYVPQESDSLYKNGDLSIKYSYIWGKLKTEERRIELAEKLESFNGSDQIFMMQRLHKTKAPEELRNIIDSTSQWEITNGDAKKLTKFKRMLNETGFPGNSIKGMFELSHDSIDRTKIINYCLECYMLGIQLQP